MICGACGAEGPVLAVHGGAQCVDCYTKVTDALREERPDIAAIRDAYVAGGPTHAINVALGAGIAYLKQSVRPLPRLIPKKTDEPA
jgi:Holliday junction resolvasome RuvABC endonuclease subunit